MALSSMKSSLRGKKLGITDSVKDILLELRSSETERVLWIDAMCINQKDIDERNRQVWLMGQVYSKAKAVIIWLGPQSEDSDLAMEFIPRLLGALFTPVNQLLRTENRDLIFHQLEGLIFRSGRPSRRF
jgi:hypothetical protein